MEQSPVYGDKVFVESDFRATASLGDFKALGEFEALRDLEALGRSDSQANFSKDLPILKR